MPSASASSAIFFVESLLATAIAARKAGQMAVARSADAEALQRAMQMGDAHLTARAQLGLAQVELTQAIGIGPYQRAKLAYSTFLKEGDGSRAAQALQVCSFVSSALDNTSRALDEAEQAYMCAERSGSAEELAWATNYRGVAAYWAGDRTQGLELLEAASWLMPSHEVQPMLNECFIRMLPAMSPLPESSEVFDLGRCSVLLDTLKARLAEPRAAPRAAGGIVAVHALVSTLETRVLALSGHEAEALRKYNKTVAGLQALPAQVWLQGLKYWAKSALTADHQGPLTQMVQVAKRSGHQGLAKAGQRLQREGPSSPRAHRLF